MYNCVSFSEELRNVKVKVDGLMEKGDLLEAAKLISSSSELLRLFT